MPRIRVLVVFLAALTLTLGSTVVAVARPGASPPAALEAGDRIPDRYIVVLKPGVNPAGFAAAQGIRPDVTYSNALNGFAANISAQVAQALARNPNVALVEQDSVMGVEVLGIDEVPTGIARIGTLENTTAAINGDGGEANVDIAVLDTGVANHPDINRAGGANFSGSGFAIFWTCDPGDTNFTDGHGHGTHVSGTIAARDNGINVNGRHVVGVVPGARIWAVKVLTDNGTGAISCIIQGVDWVTARKTSTASDKIDFVVANMSLGGGNSSALCTAVNNSVAAGVVYAVAAGNSSQDAANSSPANCSGAVTVSAIGDFDGRPGGLNDTTIAFSSCTHTEDDHFACFSNFGSTVEVAAPGVSILSTVLNGGYGNASGTSMAAPHVAGAVALYKLAGNPITNAAGPTLISQMTESGWTVAQDSACGFTGDPDSSPEPMIYVGSSCHAPADPVTDIAISSVSAPTSVVSGDTALVTVTVANVGTQDVGDTITVTLDASGGTTSSPQTVSGLNAGESSEVTFTWNTTGLSGDYTLTASHDFSDDDPGNDSSSTTVTVNEPSSGIHVGGMTGASFGFRATWHAEVNIRIVDGAGSPVADATVTGSWNPQGTGSTQHPLRTSCVTGADGWCTMTVSSGALAKSTSQTTWTVTNVTHSTFAYDPASNTVSSITVNKP